METRSTPATLATPLAAAFANFGTQLPTPFLDLSALVIRDLPLANIADLQRFISDAKSELATLTNMVQTGMELRYADQAKAQLLADGKDTGTTHVIDSDFDIAVEIGKTVTWDTKGLTELVAKIEATGGDPREYIEVKYSVSEARYKAWPQTLRSPFEALRTVTPKTPKFVLRAVGEGK